jgi:adenylate cyclase
MGQFLTSRLVFAAIGLAAALVALLLYRGAVPMVQQVDLRLKDARFLMGGVERPDPRVVVVAIDNRSVKELGRWPWSRELTGRLVAAIRRQGARVIALDMVFAEPQSPAADGALARSVAGAGNVVLGQFFREEPQPVEPAALAQVAAHRLKVLQLAPGVEQVPVTEYPAVDANLPQLARAGLDQGFFNQQPDRDGLIRQVPLLLLFNGDIYPSLALTALKRYRGEELTVAVAPHGISRIAVGSLAIPAGEHGLLPLAWYGPGGTVPTFAAADLMAGRLAAALLRDKLVFVGVTETGIADVRATPFDPAFPGVEIHATFAANALERRFLSRDSRTLALEMLAILVLPVLLGLGLSFAPGTWVGLAGFTAAGAGYLGLNLLAFSRGRLDLTMVYPLLALLLSYLGGEAYRNLVVERKGRYLRKAFSSYVSPDLVSELVRHPEQLHLGGQRRQLSVLFSDIRGFTSLAERLDPEELVRLLNRYLTPMTTIVLEERGTLDKYVGDAVMALFNAPLDVADHPQRACRAALRMLDALAALNAELARDGLPQLAIGVGIHSGEAVVGNMGSETRFDYTAIGDTVNLASRLEGLTKQYGVAIIASGETVAQSGSGFCFRELDQVRVRGKGQPVTIYELRQEPFPGQAEFERGMALFRSGAFAAAVEVFAALKESANDPVAALYLERCRSFCQAPPPALWDGVYVALEK